MKMKTKMLYNETIIKIKHGSLTQFMMSATTRMVQEYRKF